jgi:hypothetical protein
MRLRLSTRVSIKTQSKLVGIVQVPIWQHHFLQFLTILVLTGHAQASILEKTDITQMTREAKEVQIGEVVSTWTSPDPDQKMFFTFVKIKVEKTLKGNHAQEILLRQPGGAYRDPTTGVLTRQKVFGMSTFQKGEKALFFITYANDGAPTVMFQGKHQIVTNPKTRLDELVYEKSNDIELRTKGTRKSNQQDHEHEKSLYAVYERQPLDEMVSEIQKAATIKKGESTKKYLRSN